MASFFSFLSLALQKSKICKKWNRIPDLQKIANLELMKFTKNEWQWVYAQHSTKQKRSTMAPLFSFENV